MKLPDIPEIPEYPCGYEIRATEAQRLIEEVSQCEWGIGWQEFRMRWNHNEFTESEIEELRPLAALLQYAVLPPGFLGNEE